MIMIEDNITGEIIECPNWVEAEMVAQRRISAHNQSYLVGRRYHESANAVMEVNKSEKKIIIKGGNA